MTDRPILFSAPMVRALLDGQKTQTRRLIKKPATLNALAVFGPKFLLQRGNLDLINYAVGDRLWARETWRPVHSGDRSQGARYRADHPDDWRDQTVWRPAIHMPRWASRLTLIVTDVRVERLQDISEKDAVAEGIDGAGNILERTWYDYESPLDLDGLPARVYSDPRRSYASLWDTLHKPGQRWTDNPWVVAITFDTHHCNIDQMETLHGRVTA